MVSDGFLRRAVRHRAVGSLTGSEAKAAVPMMQTRRRFLTTLTLAGPQELRAPRAGHVIVSTAVDRPWSQYFCCLLEGNREYVRKYPVATKRVVRAILKAADLCAADGTDWRFLDEVKRELKA